MVFRNICNCCLDLVSNQDNDLCTQERMGEKLQKQEEQEIQKVKQLAQELEDKQFRYVCIPLLVLIQ